MWSPVRAAGLAATLPALAGKRRLARPLAAWLALGALVTVAVVFDSIGDYRLQSGPSASGAGSDRGALELRIEQPVDRLTKDVRKRPRPKAPRASRTSRPAAGTGSNADRGFPRSGPRPNGSPRKPSPAPPARRPRRPAPKPAPKPRPAPGPSADAVPTLNAPAPTTTGVITTVENTVGTQTPSKPDPGTGGGDPQKPLDVLPVPAVPLL